MVGNILVTGGAGYIGSHTVLQLLLDGYNTVVIDNLDNSSLVSIQRVKELAGDHGQNLTFHQVDLRDKPALEKVFSESKFDAVMHFAGLKAVGESVAKPLLYYNNNLIGTITLLEVMAAHGCKKLVFSSSATVYGWPKEVPCTEESPLSGMSPYGRTKLFIEDICRDVQRGDPEWRIIMLRYFNPVGAHPSGRIGEDPCGTPNNLMPYVQQVVVGRLPNLKIYGTDYTTKDGTGGLSRDQKPKTVTLISSFSLDLICSKIDLIGALYSLSLWLSNSAYIYLSVSFIQMLKALMLVAVYSIGVLLKKETFKSQTMTNMLSISFDVWGVVLQLGAVAFEATRFVLIQILLTSKGINLNPITSLYYVAPCCFVFLSVPWIFVEFPILRDTSSFHFDFVIFGTNSVCAFALNLVVFLLVGKTSALTMNVARVVKNWLLIAFSWSVIKDTVTPINLFGYGVAFLGVGYYNHCKLQALKAKDAQKKVQASDEEAGKLLEVRESEAKRNETQD